MPIEKNHYICIPAIDIDSVLKIDKKAFPQAYLEQLKKRKPVNFIDFEIIDDDDDDNDSDDYNDNENDDNENDENEIDNHKNYDYF